MVSTMGFHYVYIAGFKKGKLRQNKVCVDYKRNAPYQRFDQVVDEDSANERWRSCRAPEESVQSPTICTKAWWAPQPPSSRSVSPLLHPVENKEQQSLDVAEKNVQAEGPIKVGFYLAHTKSLW